MRGGVFIKITNFFGAWVTIMTLGETMMFDVLHSWENNDYTKLGSKNICLQSHDNDEIGGIRYYWIFNPTPLQRIPFLSHWAFNPLKISFWMIGKSTLLPYNFVKMAFQVIRP